ncbi:uncharacterized protein LOC143634798 [Bidens hawaiensis]|uniref:uncharacterized protein LOC143634798 n=1 Tax=Bidens hawaiensis TaxID=980011 RepID=UPI00404A4109
MESLLFRTGSGSVCSSPRLPAPIRHNSFSAFSPLPHLEVKNLRRLRRAASEPKKFSRLTSINAGSHALHGMLHEEVLADGENVNIRCIGSLKFGEKCFDPVSGVVLDEGRFSGVGGGSGRDGDGFGSGSGESNGNNDQNRIGAHYRKLLESNPNDPLVMRNYGKFLHEVEGDPVKAEEYYGRAILASPGDGELMSLYGKLIWDVHRDGERARYYFDQAISICPNDCTVMGSYAQFLWEAEEDEDIEEESESMVSVRAVQTI